MTHADILAELDAAGFSYRLIWTAREGRKTSVRCYSIYGTGGRLLTSLVLRDVEGGCFSFWIEERNRRGIEVDHLRRLEAGATAPLNG